ncbi:MAG: S8 family serine peptidase [Fimbriimonadaceae bacterium]|nr:S8 family serine peptidase [Fimbriimonadaceae bacterium]
MRIQVTTRAFGRLFAGVAVFAGLSLLAGAQAPDTQDAIAQFRFTAVHRKAMAALKADSGLTRNPYAVLVKFRNEAAVSANEWAKFVAGATTLRKFQLVPGLELVATNGRSPEAVVADLERTPGVEYAELDVVMHVDQSGEQRFPSDPSFYPTSWGFHNDGQAFNGYQATAGADVNAPEAWWMTIGDPDFVVAIIDTGIQYTHHNLNDKIWSNPGEIVDGLDNDNNGYVDDIRGWDFSEGDNDPMDLNGHGTHVAGIVGAEEGGTEPLQGIVGMMWQCQLMPLRCFDANGSGLMSDAALALQYAVNKGVKVSNNSYGYSSGTIIQTLYDVIQASQTAGHLFVAAAGNEGSNNDKGKKRHYPASFDLDNIISVAATDMNDQMPSWSNYGASTVDVGAPGDYILSTWLLSQGVTQQFLSGTSQAAPFVAGTAGLLYVQNPGWTYQQVRNRILNTARPIAALAGKTVSGGVVDAGTALGNAPVGPPTPPNAPGTPSLGSSGGTVTIAWSDNSNNEDGFVVERERKVGNRWRETTTVGTVGADVTSTTDQPGSGTFRYHVRAFNGVGTSNWSGWAQINN